MGIAYDTLKKQEYKFTFTVVDPDDITKTKEYYPKTYAEAVMLDTDRFYTLKDHIEALSHVTKEDHDLMQNQVSEGGIIILNDKGQVPSEYVDPETILLYRDYTNLQDLFDSCEYTPEKDYGRLAIVRNTYGDPRGKKNKWGIYRYIAKKPEDTFNLSKGWQLVMHEKDIDFTYSWSDLSDDIKTSTRLIDEAVRMKHSHDNIDTLNGLEHSDDGRLKYRGNLVMYRDGTPMIIVVNTLNDPNVLPGDLAWYVTHTQEAVAYEEQPDPPGTEFMIETLSGDCSEYQKGRPFMTVAQQYKMEDVTNLTSFFEDCSRLVAIHWYYTPNVTNTSKMMKNCAKLLRFPALDMSKVTDTTEMFYGCSQLEYIPSMDFKSLIDAREMFYQCIHLKKIGSLSASKLLKNAEKMLYGCKSLVEAPEIKLTSCENANSMFYGCESMIRVPALSTRLVKDMTYMFYGCTNLKSIANIDFTSCVDAIDMFTDCPSLEYIGVRPNTIHTNISFRRTSLSIAGLKQIIDGLQRSTTGNTLNIYDTPASRRLTDEIRSAISNKGWILSY